MTNEKPCSNCGVDMDFDWKEEFCSLECKHAYEDGDETVSAI